MFSKTSQTRLALFTFIRHVPCSENNICSEGLMYVIRNTAQKPTIFLGLASEGMGHATRARTLINQLKDTYDVHVFCGDRVYD